MRQMYGIYDTQYRRISDKVVVHLALALMHSPSTHRPSEVDSRRPMHVMHTQYGNNAHVV